MRLSARLLLGLCGLALAVPAVMAGPLGDDQASSVPAGMQAPQPPPHHHKGLFGRRHCVECQRAYAKAHDGIDIPPPPEIGPMAAAPGHVHTGQSGDCLTCQGGVVVSGPVIVGDPHAPGYAVVGGGGATVAGADAPGYAVVGETVTGPEPAPIGVSRARQPSWADSRTGAPSARPGAGPVDPSVVPTGLPPAQVALTAPGHDRPHIISHLLGIPKLGQSRRAREEQERQKHAAIAYDQPNRPVNELPAAMVYGKDGR
jgi:hypothetical protein